MIKSLNGKLILQPYGGDKSIKSEVKSGFATIKRSQLVGLEVLADAVILSNNNEILIDKGSVVYISEETLKINDKYHQQMENSEIGVPFVIGDFSHVVMVQK